MVIFKLERVPVILNHLFRVMAGLVPAINAFLAEVPARKTWMPAKTGSPPRDAAGCLCAGMTAER